MTVADCQRLAVVQFGKRLVSGHRFRWLHAGLIGLDLAAQLKLRPFKAKNRSGFFSKL
jgi:hypothetical protein